MNTLVVFFAAIACAVAEPLILRGDLPYFYNYRSVLGSYPTVGNVIGTTLPYYYGLKSQYHDRDLIGQVRYGHIEPGQSQHAIQDAFGNKVGSFSYYDSTGKLVQTNYIADAAGYRVTSNNLPVGLPVVPLSPLSVEDTPEVKAAKFAHFQEVEKIKSRSRRDVIVTPGLSHIVSPIITKIVPAALPTTKVDPVLKRDGFLDDTPEVKLVKEHHKLEVEAAKIRNLTPLTSLVHPFFGYSTLGNHFIDPVFRF